MKRGSTEIILYEKKKKKQIQRHLAQNQNYQLHDGVNMKNRRSGEVIIIYAVYILAKFNANPQLFSLHWPSLPSIVIR